MKLNREKGKLLSNYNMIRLQRNTVHYTMHLFNFLIPVMHGADSLLEVLTNVRLKSNVMTFSDIY